MKNRSIADIEGPWNDVIWESGLLERCKNAWDKNLEHLTNEEIATFLRQRIALDYLLPIAYQRIESDYDDDTEMFEGELRAIVTKISQNL